MQVHPFLYPLPHYLLPILQRPSSIIQNILLGLFKKKELNPLTYANFDLLYFRTNITQKNMKESEMGVSLICITNLLFKQKNLNQYPPYLTYTYLSSPKIFLFVSANILMITFLLCSLVFNLFFTLNVLIITHSYFLLV